MKKSGVNVIKIFLSIITIVGFARGLCAYIYKKTDNMYLKKNKECVKFHGYYNTLISWMDLLQEKGSIARYFPEDSSVAVYGMGKIGELVCKDLQYNGVQVLYGIDGNNSGENIATGLHVYSSEQKELPSVDYIIVSISYLSDVIIPELKKIPSVKKIITIDEVLGALKEDEK